MTVERVFVIGGTGNIGRALVKDLISKNVALTLFARSPEKVASMFATDALNVIQGDLQNLSPLKDALKGHTRLFMVLNDFATMVQTKATVSQLAYEAGVQQIVDISSVTVSFPWRTNFVGDTHRRAEEAILAIPNRGKYVSLRPGRFMSNLLWYDRIMPDDTFRSTEDENTYQGWISTDDIGVVAANILTDDIEKHGDAVYELVWDCITHRQRAEIMSRVLGRNIQYKKLSSVEQYNAVSKFNFPHAMAYAFSGTQTSQWSEENNTTGLPILLGKEPESFESYIARHKHLF